MVGDRAFFAAPRATLQLDRAVQTTAAGQNLISSALWGADTATLPSPVYNALKSASVTAAFTDIRPEDAEFAEARAASALDTTAYAGLGYGPGPNTLIGTPIHSAFSATQADPVAFNISGNDPFTGAAVPKAIAIPIGAAPIVFLINRTNASGLGAPGAFTNLTDAEARNVFSGAQCDTAALGGTIPDVPVYPILREPLSGAMNASEFTVFRLAGTPTQSQEASVGAPAYPSAANPLNKACLAGGGVRYRAIGTGEEINTAILKTKDSIGYAFFSYGNVSKIAGSPNYGYLQLDGVDPISATYSNGELPTCTAPCPKTPGARFPNLRSGKYRAWSVLRVVTDVSGVNYANTSALVISMQENINSTVPDSVPFKVVGSDPGLKYYRSHYLQIGVAPNNGLSGQTEAGGDMGGCIEPVGPAPGTLNCHQ